MPLLDANQRINSALAERTRNIASHHAAAAREANAVVTDLLALDDAALTEWLNSQPLNELFALFGQHEALGVAANAALDAVAAVLESSGLPAPTIRVDVRPFADKLAEAGRQFAVNPDTGAIAVTTPEPEPDPEP